MRGMLRRVRGYLGKIFALDALAEGAIPEDREDPDVPVARVWMSALLMLVVGQRSLRQFDEMMKRCHGKGAGGRPAGAPSERTVRRVFEWLRLDALRELVKVMTRTLRRNKTPLAAAGARGLVAVAIDGKEVFASGLRKCEDCLERTVWTVDRKTGEKRSHTEYYHRVAVCFLIDCLIPLLLDVEMVRPGEGELAAGRRLLRRVLKNHPRLFDVVSADALYGDKEFLQMILKARKRFVVTLKDDRRDAYDEADRLRKLVEPATWGDRDRKCRVWDIPDIRPWWKAPGVRLRVVWSDEKVRQPAPGRRRRGESAWVDSTWVWLTDIPSSLGPARLIWRFGHRRWHIENRCFHEGVREWGFDHCFHHHPNAICAFLMTMSVAMILVHTFLKRNLKEALRKLYTIATLRADFLGDFGRGFSWAEWVRGLSANGP